MQLWKIRKESLDFESEITGSNPRIWDIQVDGTEMLWMSDESGQLWKSHKNGSFIALKEDFNLGELIVEGDVSLELEQVRDWRKMKDDDMWERKREKLRQQKKKDPESLQDERHLTKKAKTNP